LKFEKSRNFEKAPIIKDAAVNMAYLVAVSGIQSGYKVL